MKEYEVKITETLEASVKVKAETQEEAQEIARKQWEDGYPVLDADNFVGADFKANEGRELTQADLANTMEVMMVVPGKRPYTATIGKDLDSMQRAVGGNIEAVYFFDDPVAIICNEEGKLQGMKPNRSLKDERHNVLDVIAGPFFMCGITDDDFCSMSKELQEKYEGVFHDPETFLRLGEKLIAIPSDPIEDPVPAGAKARSKGMEI